MQRHLLHTFPGFDIGGAQLRTVTWINGLGADYRHTILSLNGATEATTQIDPAIDVTVLAPPDPTGPLPGRLMRYMRLLREVGPDLLLTNNWGSIELALAWRLQTSGGLLHIESGFGPDEAHRDLRRRIWARRFALSGQGQVVVPSAALRRRVVEDWGFRSDRVHHIPDGIDCRRFAEPTGEKPPALRVLPGGMLIGTVAVLRPEKDLQLLLRAFARVLERLDASLLIAGDGSERQALEALSRELGIDQRVVFTGHVDAVEQVYPLLDIFVLSSFTEQMPNAVMQAMAAGLPVVATRVGDVADMVGDGGSGYLVDAGDTEALAHSIIALAGDADARAALGEALQARARALFDASTMVGAYGALIAAVCNR